MEKKLKELLDILFNKKVRKKSYGSSDTYETNIIDSDGKIIVEQAIRSFLLDNREEHLGMLEAKVFMYEQIIAKSNFAPMLPKIESIEEIPSPPQVKSEEG